MFTSKTKQTNKNSVLFSIGKKQQTYTTAMKEKLRESSQMCGNFSLRSKSQRRGDDKEEILLGGSSVTAATLQRSQFFP